MEAVCYFAKEKQWEIAWTRAGSISMAGDIFAYIDGIWLCGESFFFTAESHIRRTEGKEYRIRSPGGSAVLGSVIYFAAAGNFVYREHLAQRKIAEVCRIFLKESETKSLPLLRKNCNQGLQLEPQKLCNRTKAWFFVQILFTNSSLCDTITS